MGVVGGTGDGTDPDSFSRIQMSGENKVRGERFAVDSVTLFMLHVVSCQKKHTVDSLQLSGQRANQAVTKQRRALS